MIYAQGTRLSQVSVLGIEEKRAVTVCAFVANSGESLPFLAVYVGETHKSTPSKQAEHHNGTINAGFRYEYGGSLYWSNLRTMRALVDDIIGP